MQFFNRITTTLGSKVEKVVSHIEDHDAVVEVSLKTTRNALATARVRLSRVQKDGAQLRQQLQALQEKEKSWTARAKHVAAEDEAKALACVAQRNHCREQAAKTLQSLERHEELAAQLSVSVDRMEQRLAELTQQRNLMRSRHSTADAMRVINRIENEATGAELDDALERWEMKIMEAEYESGASLRPMDTLDAEFSAQEHSAALKADLAELLDDDNNAPTKE